MPQGIVLGAFKNCFEKTLDVGRQYGRGLIALIQKVIAAIAQLFPCTRTTPPEAVPNVEIPPPAGQGQGWNINQIPIQLAPAPEPVDPPVEEPAVPNVEIPPPAGPGRGWNINPIPNLIVFRRIPIRGAAPAPAPVEPPVEEPEKPLDDVPPLEDAPQVPAVHAPLGEEVKQILEETREFLKNNQVRRASNLIERKASKIPDATIFNILWDESRGPAKRMEIYELARVWASSREVHPNPDHLYAPIFTELKKQKQHLVSFRFGYTPDDYYLRKDDRVANDNCKYEYIYKLLLTFQELSEANLTFIEKVYKTIDLNCKTYKYLDVRNLNPYNEPKGYSFGLARDITKMRHLYYIVKDEEHAYIPAGRQRYVSNDTDDKIRRGVEVLWKTFQKVVEVLPEQPQAMSQFFEKAFDPRILCFDLRVLTLGEFAAQLEFPADFGVVLPPNLNRMGFREAQETRAYAYFNAFQHRQILEYVAEKNDDLDEIDNDNILEKYQQHREAYLALRQKVRNRGTGDLAVVDEELQDLYDQFITEDRFEDYLRDENIGTRILPKRVWEEALEPYFTP